MHFRIRFHASDVETSQTRYTVVLLNHLHDELRDPLDHLRRVPAVEWEELEAVHKALHALLLERAEVPSPWPVHSNLIDCTQRGCRAGSAERARARGTTALLLVRRDAEDVRHAQQNGRAVRGRKRLLNLVLQALVPVDVTGKPRACNRNGKELTSCR